jgi:hypothetical protein
MFNVDSGQRRHGNPRTAAGWKHEAVFRLERLDRDYVPSL